MKALLSIISMLTNFRWKWGGILQDSVTLSNTKVIQVLQIIIRPENLPVYLHCLDGTHVTGLVVMCFRKLQSWNLSTSTAEFCQFEKDAEISREESQFVEAFRGEIEIPPVIPKWLWQGIRSVKHPTFRLRLLSDPREEEGTVMAPNARQSELPKTLNRSGYYAAGATILDWAPGSLLKHPGATGVPGDNTPLSGLIPLTGVGAPEGGVIYGNGKGISRSGFGGIKLTNDLPKGGEESSGTDRGVAYKASLLKVFDRNASPIVGLPHKGSRDLHDRESMRNLEALDLEGIDVIASRRLQAWPHQARPHSMISSSSGKGVPL
ncbi:hypothetical protein CY35_19G029400 [Sphagnum magellanicum]|nr:hypothetical protein CY35_19G029400 [Sphagnum magellanicum]